MKIMKKTIFALLLAMISMAAQSATCLSSPSMMIVSGTTRASVWDVTYPGGKSYRVSLWPGNYWRVRDPSGVWLKSAGIPIIPANSMTTCYMTKILNSYFYNPSVWIKN